MATPDLLSRRPLATYRRSHPVEDEETIPDSEDSISHGHTRPPNDDGGNPTSSPSKLLRLHLLVLPVQFIGPLQALQPPPLPYRILA